MVTSHKNQMHSSPLHSSPRSEDSRSPRTHGSPSLTETPEIHPRRQESFSCSVLLGSHPALSRQASQFSVSSAASPAESLSGLPRVPQSPIACASEFFDGIEDKENLGDSLKTYHRRQPSVIINSEVEQSYSNMLSVFGSKQTSVQSSPSKTFYPAQKSRRSLYPQNRRMALGPLCETRLGQEEKSADVISDCSSILESEGVQATEGMEMTEEVADEGQDERVSTIYTNLSSDSSRIIPSGPGTEGNFTPSRKEMRGSATSPYGQTTTNTDSNHFEIDLFESPAPAFLFEHTVRASCDLSEHQLGALPTRAYCPTCRRDVSTRVSFELPRLPL
jgi:hypothetical protein